MNSGQKAPKELNSWKEIATFLRVSERTAQNWEQKLGLPVQRLPGARGRVLADPAELENWKKTAAIKQSNGRIAWHASVKFLRSYAVLATAVVLTGLGMMAIYYYAGNSLGRPASFRTDFATFIVTDNAGREIWRKIFPVPFYLPHYAPDPTSRSPAWIGDLDGDSKTETLFLYDPVNRDAAGCVLICFSDEGQEKWRFVPGRKVSDLVGTYSPPFIIANFLVADPNRDGAKEILVTSHHPSYHPNQFVVLSMGKVIGEYWHSGFLESLDTWDMDADGVDEILLADVNNGYETATLVVLDPRQVAGTSSQPEGDEHQIQGFERGKERAVVLFPRSCINRQVKDRNVVGLLAVHGEKIRVEVIEKRDDRGCSIAYTLDRNLTPIHVAESDRYKAVHRELELAGKLDHPFSDQEVEQLKKDVRVFRHW